MAGAIGTYPNDATANALRNYRQRDIAEQLGGAETITAALQHLGAERTTAVTIGKGEALASLLDIAKQVQGGHSR